MWVDGDTEPVICYLACQFLRPTEEFGLLCPPVLFRGLLQELGGQVVAQSAHESILHLCNQFATLENQFDALIVWRFDIPPVVPEFVYLLLEHISLRGEIAALRLNRSALR